MQASPHTSKGRLQLIHSSMYVSTSPVLRLCDDRYMIIAPCPDPFCPFSTCFTFVLYRTQPAPLNHDTRLFLCTLLPPPVVDSKPSIYWPPSSSIRSIQSRRAVLTLPANYGGGGRANRESKKPRSCGSAPLSCLAEAKPIRAKRKKKANARSGFRPGLAHIEQSACMTRIRLSPLSARLVAGTKRSLGIWPPARRWRLESSPSPRAHLTIDSYLDVVSAAAMCVCVWQNIRLVARDRTWL